MCAGPSARRRSKATLRCWAWWIRCLRWRRFACATGSCAPATRSTTAEVNTRLATYQQSFDDLFGGAKGAQPFIDFLAKASQHFNVLGVAIGRVQHVTLVWDRFHTALKGKAPRPEVLIELLAALAQVL